jgi:hypothetical protein
MTEKVCMEELLRVLSTICSEACGTGGEPGTVDGGRISAAGAANGINSPQQFSVLLSIVFDPLFFFYFFLQHQHWILSHISLNNFTPFLCVFFVFFHLPSVGICLPT